MAPVTFHGGPLHGQTVDSDGPWPPQGPPGTYRLDGATYVHEPAQDPEGPDVVHVRPAEPVQTEVRPRTRKVTRR